MKALLVGIFLFVGLPLATSAGEARDNYTHQFLSGIADGIPRVEKVYCYDTCALSGMPAAFELIATENVSPNNAREPVDDMNLTSASGITIRVLESKGLYEIAIDATSIRVPKRFGVKPAELVKVVLEAIRRTAILAKVLDYRVTIQSADDFKDSSERQLKIFEAHFKERPFWTP